MPLGIFCGFTQPGLCWTWLETPKTGFRTTRLNLTTGVSPTQHIPVDGIVADQFSKMATRFNISNWCINCYERGPGCGVGSENR